MPDMRMTKTVIAAAVFSSLCASPQTLDIHFVDVEGGQATLIVTPAKESLLVDAGWPGFEGRDAARIAAAAKKAGVSRIDYLLVTHYHRDHVGGVEQLSERLPVGVLVTHGPNTESGQGASEMNALFNRAAAKSKSLVVKPGDRIPLKGADVVVVAARGERIARPLPGAGASNASCAAARQKEADNSENARSVGFLLTFGKFRFVDLGDLTWNKEIELACPRSLLGTVDVYLTTHHGMNISGPAELVHALRPRVAIMNNGAKKGGSPEAWQVVRQSPGLEDIWQVHFALAGCKDHNSPEDKIANMDESCQGYGISLSARKDGGFAVHNARNGVTKEYKPRKG